MRSSFGGDYGIALTLPTDSSVLANYNLSAISDNVNMIGFMAYDVYSYGNATPWLEGHTDIRVIGNATTTLESSGVDMSKVNMGLAGYGRGYTLGVNASCNYLGCNASAPSTPGVCLGEMGVLSLVEIDNIISSTNATAQYVPNNQMMVLQFLDQYIAYDNVYTMSLKKVCHETFFFEPQG
jgi:chitinase